MRIDYTVNSNGEISKVSDSRPINIKKYDTRRKELEEIWEKIMLNLEEKYPDISRNSAFYMIQPYYTTDRILLFTKLQMSSDSKIVKNFNNPEYKFKNEQEEDFYKSIAVEELPNGQKKWWYIEVISLVFERNLNDCEFILAGSTIPIAYNSVFKNFDLVELADVDYRKVVALDKRYILRDGDEKRVDLQNINAFVNLAITCYTNSEIEEDIYRLVRQYAEETGTSKKDNLSNDKQLALLVAMGKIDSKLFYSIYESVKQILNNLYPEINGEVKYKGNSIYFTLNGENQTIYVSSSLNGTSDVSFVLNGNIINDTKNFLQALRQDDLFEKQDWFENTIVPVIEEKLNGEKQHDKGE